MKVLELFAGSRSIGKTAEKLGMQVYSSDLFSFKGIDYQIDIEEFNEEKVPWKPDIIWASPPCTGFSVASIGKHWEGGNKAYIPKSNTSKLGIAIVKRTIEIIKFFEPKYWFIENPRGVLRKMNFMKEFDRHTVTYCQYGDERMKPTDIWTNSKNWIPKPMCHNGDTCHISAPRGSKTGTQGRSNAYERSKIPTELCLEILKSCL